MIAEHVRLAEVPDGGERIRERSPGPRTTFGKQPLLGQEEPEPLKEEIKDRSVTLSHT